MEKYIDLHTHSNLSDGALTPVELVRKAADLKLAAIALTDHDLVDGLAEAIEEGKKVGVEVVPGIELTTYVEDKEYHILGYFIDFHDHSLTARLKEIQGGRVERAKKQIEVLNNLGYQVTFDQVHALAQGSVGKPHLAMAVIKESGNEALLKEKFGELPTTGMFIQKYFSEGGAAHLKKDGYNLDTALKEIARLGGISSLAHPGWETADIRDGQVTYRDDELEGMVKLGLNAVEVYAHYDSQETTQAVLEHYQQKVTELGLLETGGSDYHGFGNAGKELGFANFYLKVPYRLLELMKDSLVS